MNPEEYRTLEEDLALLLEKSRRSPSLSIKEILDVLSGKGRSLILIFLSLPFCQPIQIPGLSTPFGIVIAFLGLRIAFGKHTWLPKRILLKTISSTTIQKIAQKFLHMMMQIRRVIRPRL
ncbi:MAG: exopolysaccharide biosynthesis protein, partial [Chlamydiales bacterium]